MSLEDEKRISEKIDFEVMSGFGNKTHVIRLLHLSLQHEILLHRQVTPVYIWRDLWHISLLSNRSLTPGLSMLFSPPWSSFTMAGMAIFTLIIPYHGSIMVSPYLRLVLFCFLGCSLLFALSVGFRHRTFILCCNHNDNLILNVQSRLITWTQFS